MSVQIRMESVSRMKWNHRPDSNGISARNGLEYTYIADIRDRVSMGQKKRLIAAEYLISRTTLYSALAN